MLLARMDGDAMVTATHLDLARDLGTAREVVSRQLERMAQKGWLQTQRGSIRLIDLAALERLGS